MLNFYAKISLQLKFLGHNIPNTDYLLLFFNLFSRFLYHRNFNLSSNLYCNCFILFYYAVPAQQKQPVRSYDSKFFLRHDPKTIKVSYHHKKQLYVLIIYILEFHIYVLFL